MQGIYTLLRTIIKNQKKIIQEQKNQTKLLIELKNSSSIKVKNYSIGGGQ